MEQFNLDTTDFEDAWDMYQKRLGSDESIELRPEQIRRIFFSGGALAIGILSNRLAKLPGAIEPGELVQGLINTISESLAELEKKTGIRDDWMGNA